MQQDGGLRRSIYRSFRKCGRVAFVEKEVQEIPVFKQSGTQESEKHPEEIQLSLILGGCTCKKKKKKGFKINFPSYHPQRYISFSFA